MRAIGLGLFLAALLGLAVHGSLVVQDMEGCWNRWGGSGYEYEWRGLGACTVNIGGGWLPEESVTVTHYRTGR